VISNKQSCICLFAPSDLPSPSHRAMPFPHTLARISEQKRAVIPRHKSHHATTRRSRATPARSGVAVRRPGLPKACGPYKPISSATAVKHRAPCRTNCHSPAARACRQFIRGRLLVCPHVRWRHPVLDFWRWMRRHRTSRRCKPAVLFYLRVGTPVRVI